LKGDLLAAAEASDVGAGAGVSEGGLEPPRRCSDEKVDVPDAAFLLVIVGTTAQSTTPNEHMSAKHTTHNTRGLPHFTAIIAARPSAQYKNLFA